MEHNEIMVTIPLKDYESLVVHKYTIASVLEREEKLRHALLETAIYKHDSFVSRSGYTNPDSAYFAYDTSNQLLLLSAGLTMDEMIRHAILTKNIYMNKKAMENEVNDNGTK